MPTKSEKKGPRWFGRPLTESSKTMVKQAIVNYILAKGLRHKLPKGNVETCKNVLPYLQPFEPKWRDVNHDNFNTGQHKAHGDLLDTTRNFLKSRRELDELLDEAEGSEPDEDEEAEEEQDELREDESHQFQGSALNPIQPITNVPKLADLSAHQSIVNGPSASDFITGQKRVQSDSIRVEIEEPGTKRPRLGDVQGLFDDYMAKMKAHHEARDKWKSAVDGFQCLKDPEPQPKEGI